MSNSLKRLRFSLLTAAREFINAELSGPQQQLERKNIERVLVAFSTFLEAKTSGLEGRQEEIMINFFKAELAGSLEKLAVHQRQYQAFILNIRNVPTELEQQVLVLQFAEQLGSSGAQLKGDRRALNRYFGSDAIIERYTRLTKDIERYICFLLDRLSVIASQWFARLNEEEGRHYWRKLQLEVLLSEMLSQFQEERLINATFTCLSRLIRDLKGEHSGYLSSSTIQYVYRFAQDYRQPVWIQVEAISLIADVAPQSLLPVAKRLFTDAKVDDLLFLRRKLITIVCRYAPAHPELWDILRFAVNDPSEFVRQGLAASLDKLPTEMVQAFLPILSQDKIPQVHAMVLLRLPALAAHAEMAEGVAELLLDMLHLEQSEFGLRTAMEVLPDFFQVMFDHYQQEPTQPSSTSQEQALPLPENLQHYYRQLIDTLTVLHTQHSASKVRRWAAASRERLWARVYLLTHQHLQALHTEMSAWQRIRLGKRKRIPRHLRGVVPADIQARLLAVDAQQGFGFDVSQGSVLRDHKSRFRLWRFLHEFRHTATDKRQNYSHMQGRVYYGDYHVPSGIVAERSATKVPGEPLFNAEEEGWRPYLPLVDQLLSALDQGWPTKAIKLVTSEGQTWLTPPGSLFKRLRARWLLTWNFNTYAQLRNWTEADSDGPSTYLKAVQALGFTIELKPHTDHGQRYFSLDQKVQRFFPALIPPWFMDSWRQFENYFFSVYQNSLTHLLWFCSALSVIFFGGHLRVNWQMRRARKSIPLVVGGWGTRGKSGTERLKAAVFNAMGYHVVSKTTGCEAMFLHGTALQPLHEMFLFRPYEKASIWEQANVVMLSEQLGADVFLWECMGLTPRYIEILQQQWMNDDIATITNCYPDHEDIQGPAGVDIPKVMMRFVPKKSVLISSEEEMRPFLEEAAREKGSEFHKINWLDAGLLTNDVMQRFPYQEHPYNIALVLKMGALLNLSAEYCLKEMADRVVADLGVLKVFPVSEVQGRKLCFINGMSANERFGTLSNWKRVAMDEPANSEPGADWVSTVVNNRADRVARSQVFAKLLVEDIGANKHFLIGSNLDGLQNYIDAAWEQYAAEFNLVDLAETGGAANAAQAVKRIAKRLRVPQSQEAVNQRLRAMLSGSNLSDKLSLEFANEEACARQIELAALEAPLKQAVLKQWQQDLSEWRALSALISKIEQTERNQLAALNEPTRLQLGQWFKSRFVVVSDFYTSGNQLIKMIAEHTPPGLTNRVMGLQNIKGTGLDFVYRWQAWDRTFKLCEQLNSDDEVAAKNAASQLANIQDFGFLDEQVTRASVAQVKHQSFAQNEQFQAELTLIIDALDKQLKQLGAADTTAKKSNPFKERLIDFAESVLDPGQAITRRKKANQIYRDLAAQRISHARAALELQNLNKSQKGGWLRKALNH